MKAGDHGPDELYEKFKVQKTKSGYELDWSREFFFVLRPETDDHAARAALAAYAGACSDSYPELAQAIWQELYRIAEGTPRDPDRPLPTTPEGWKEEQYGTDTTA